MLEFKDDLAIILKVLNVSAYDLSDALGFDVPTISNWLNGKQKPDRRSKEDIYEFAYKEGLRINDAHSNPLKRSSKEQEFILLYHGSKSGIDGEIDLNHARTNNDFGSGFYLGETLVHSMMIAADYKDSHVYSFGLFPRDINIYEFKTDLNGLLTIAYNRGRLKDYKGSKKLKEILKLTDGADVIVAPIADNRMFDIIDEFVEGMITDKACIYALAALDLGKQYVLKTDKAISKLGLIREFYVCKKEKEDSLQRRNQNAKERMNKIKNFRKLNREGKFIEELL